MGNTEGVEFVVGKFRPAEIPELFNSVGIPGSLVDFSSTRILAMLSQVTAAILMKDVDKDWREE
jgi:hypothetical protein